MKKDAEVSVGANVSEAEKAAGRLKEAFRDAAHDLVMDIGGAAKSVIGSLTSVATSAASINFASAHEQVKAFESDTAKLATFMGRSLDSVRDSIEATGIAIGKRPGEIAAWVSAVGELTYSFEDAQASISSLSELSAKTGRNVEAFRGMAVTLGQMGVAGKDTASVLGTMAAQAEALKTDGGVAALADQFDAAGDAVTRFATRGRDGIKEMTAFLGVLGKDLDAVSAKRVQQAALNTLMGDARGWERYLGRQIIDDKGKIQDPAKVYADIYRKASRQFKDPETLRSVMINNFGPELGTALLRAGKSGDFDKVASLAKAEPTSTLPDAQKKLLATDAGKRSVAEAELSKSSRDLMGSSTLLGKAADALQQFAAKNPFTSTAGAAVAGAAGSAALGAGSKIVGGLIAGGAGGAKAVFAGKAALGVLGTGAAVLGSAAAGGYVGYRIGNRLFNERDTAGNYDLADADKELVRLKAVRDKKRAEKGWAPIGTGKTEMPVASSNPAELRHLEEAVTRGMSGAKFTIINATGGPVDVANQNAQSAAAGSQR